MSVGAIGGGGIQELYIALAELQQEQRKAARQARHASEEAQVEAMFEAAEHIGDAAHWQAIGVAMSGAVQMGAGALNATGAESSARDVDALGKFGQAVTAELAGQAQAAQKTAEARGTAAGSAAADARDIEGDARQTAEAMLRRLEQAEETQNASVAAALRA